MKRDDVSHDLDFTAFSKQRGVSLMSGRSQVAFLILSSTLVTWLIPGAAGAQTSAQMWNMEQGTSEREWSYKRKPPVETITFGWIPELDRQTTLYFLQARCDIDNKKAKNKVSFLNVQLTGVASGNTVKAAKASKSIRQGEGKAALWDLTPVVGELLRDDTVLVSGEVKAKRALKAHQAMTCSLSVWELFDTNDLRPRTRSQRLRYFGDFVVTIERARRLPLVLRTGQTEAFATGDDGDLQMGAGWPKPRFTDNGDGTVTDNLTGLVWLQNANCFEGELPWRDALARSNALFDGCTTCGGTEGDCGLTDGSVAGEWRLPNRFELESLLDLAFRQPALSNAAGTAQWVEGDAFSGVQSAESLFYWSSTTVATITAAAWDMNLGDGFVGNAYKTDASFVWPVRGGQ
jgi:hypothetical protein